MVAGTSSTCAACAPALISNATMPGTRRWMPYHGVDVSRKTRRGEGEYWCNVIATWSREVDNPGWVMNRVMTCRMGQSSRPPTLPALAPLPCICHHHQHLALPEQG